MTRPCSIRRAARSVGGTTGSFSPLHPTSSRRRRRCLRPPFPSASRVDRRMLHPPGVPPSAWPRATFAEDEWVPLFSEDSAPGPSVIGSPAVGRTSSAAARGADDPASGELRPPQSRADRSLAAGKRARSPESPASVPRTSQESRAPEPTSHEPVRASVAPRAAPVDLASQRHRSPGPRPSRVPMSPESRRQVVAVVLMLALAGGDGLHRPGARELAALTGPWANGGL